ncbi:hypothetical protein I204_08415 [Kwoniella mangroviensis CBS 8886]|nr:hypothetical protein I204_08415 [Kwoniella mangroviensis CBS 8886]
MRFTRSAITALFAAILANAAPAPVPAGGVGVRPNDTAPEYHTMTDFDFQSLNLALNQEWIELDLFNYGVRTFSVEDFAAAGINEEEISLNSSWLTKGESGVYGFLPHLDSRPSAQLLLQSITTEARQQMAFRQLAGAFPMPVYFETGISQAMAWSLLQHYIVSCPAENPRIEWPIFPNLNVTNDANLLVDGYNAAISHNRTSLTEPGRRVEFTWDAPKGNVSYDGLYNTTVGGNVTDPTKPKYVAWINQLNATYTEFNQTGNYTGYTFQPGGVVFNNTDDGIVNGTSFIALTDSNPYVTPYNLSLLNDVIIAWGLYQAN